MSGAVGFAGGGSGDDLLGLQRLQPHRVSAACRGRGGPRAARDRAGHAAACGHRADAALVRVADRGARARRLRRRCADLLRVRGRHCARRVRGSSDEQGSPLGLPGGRDRRPQRPLPCGRPEVLRPAAEPGARPDDRDRVHRRQPPALASRDVEHRHALRRGQGLGDPGDRVRELGPVPLHVAPLLGGRRDGRDAPHRLARPLPRQDGHRATTRCRGSRSTSRCSRRSRRPRSRSRRSRRPTSTRSPLPVSLRTRSSRRSSRRPRISAPCT